LDQAIKPIPNSQGVVMEDRGIKEAAREIGFLKTRHTPCKINKDIFRVSITPAKPEARSGCKSGDGIGIAIGFGIAAGFSIHRNARSRLQPL
jgi:hypothetical protein